jgi:hypothetical protein
LAGFDVEFGPAAAGGVDADGAGIAGSRRFHMSFHTQMDE